MESIPKFPAGPYIRLSRRVGFNLVELLVVIAIITILTAIIIPVINRARATTRQTVCVSNQRQIVQAILMRAQDENRLPAATDLWSELDLPPKLYKCPTHPQLAHGYIYNNSLAGKGLGNIPAPQRTPLTADGQEQNALSFYMGLEYRHGDKLVAGFVDGHVTVCGNFPHAIYYSLIKVAHMGDSYYDIYRLATDGEDTNLTNTPDITEMNPDICPDGGSIAFYWAKPAESSRQLQIGMMDIDGKNRRNLTTVLSFDPAFSPDGSQIAFGTREGIRVMDINYGNQTLLTGRGANSPAWSPDGRMIAYTLYIDLLDTRERSDIYLMNADGSKQRNLTNNPSLLKGLTFSPDGRTIVFISDRAGSQQLFSMNLKGEQLQQLTHLDSHSVDSPRFSPDGEQIAFVFQAEGSAQHGIYTINPDGSNMKCLKEPGDHMIHSLAWGIY